MIDKFTPNTLAKYFDQTLLKPYVTEQQIKDFCLESDRYGFAMVAIHSAPVAFCKTILNLSIFFYFTCIRKKHFHEVLGFPVFSNKKCHKSCHCGNKAN